MNSQFRCMCDGAVHHRPLQCLKARYGHKVWLFGPTLPLMIILERWRGEIYESVKD